MTSDRGIDPFELADQLRAFTQRDQVISSTGEETTKFRPSLRGIASAVGGIGHQRLSEFLRNPTGATQSMLDRISSVINAPQFLTRGEGQQVTYVDAAVFTPDVVSRIDLTDVGAFRLVTQESDSDYNGYRTTGWTADVSRLNELLDAAPGGRNNITRIVLYVKKP